MMPPPKNIKFHLEGRGLVCAASITCWGLEGHRRLQLLFGFESGAEPLQHGFLDVVFTRHLLDPGGDQNTAWPSKFRI